MSDRYRAAEHKLHTAMAMNPNKHILEPKHMRVGMSKAYMKGLVDLLISKGIFAAEEYSAAVERSAEEEAEPHRLDLARKVAIDPSNLSLG